MPGFHSKKERRQAKHIMSGYKKKGVSANRRKKIAWATVNRLKNEDWQFNGAGEPVFIGKPQASQFDPSGTVSPGMPYLPDEVAKMFIKESGLRKSDTVPKRVIVRYLESMGLSSGLASDVAMVLRNVYGVQPIFDEETLFARSGALIEELTGAVSESFPMPFIDDSEPRELTEVDVIGSFLANEIMESTDDDYDFALAHLAMLPPSEFMDVVAFHEAVGPAVFSYFGELVSDGYENEAEQILNGICFPNTIKFMPEHIQAVFEDAADDVIKAGTAKLRAKTPALPKIPAPPKGSFHKEGPKVGKELASQDKEWASKLKGAKAKIAQQDKQRSAKADPKAQADKQARAAASKAASKEKIDKEGLSLKTHLAKAGQDQPGPKGSAAVAKFHAMRKEKAAAEKADADKKAAAEKADADEKARGFKAQRDAEKAAEPTKEPAKGGVLKRAGKAALGLMKRVVGGKKDSEKPEAEKTKSDKPGLVHRAIGAVTGVGGAAVGGFTGGFKRGAGVWANDVKRKMKNIETHGSTKDPEPEADDEKPSKKKGADSEAPPKGVWNRFAHAVGRFAKSALHHAKEGFKKGVKNATPGIHDTIGKGGSSDAPKQEKERVDKSAAGQEDPQAQTSSLVRELTNMLGEEYPELGKTAYGPAGDPRKGPELAKKYLQPAGVETRMFSDPEKREKARKAKLDDVMAAINGMKKAADDAGVPPEGMFLNLYRDMHREKVRYS